MTATSSTSAFFSPFTLRAWDTENDWQPYLDHDPAAATALEALRKLFPPTKLIGRNFLHHQLAVDYSMRAGRWRLLEISLLLASLPDFFDYPGRTLIAREYGGAFAELHAALILQALGFGVTRDPVTALSLPTTSKPDWLAVRDGFAAGVEVKCPMVGENVSARENVVAEVIKTAGLLAPALRFDLELRADALATLTNGRWTDSKRVQELTLDALIELQHQHVAAGELAEFRRTLSDTRFEGFWINEEAERVRLRTDIEDAALQLKQLQPGIVVLSTFRDPMLRYRSHAIREMLAETWAQHIACVLVVTPTSPGAIIECVPGPRFAELPELRVRVCERGHAHVDAFRPHEQCNLA